MAGPYAFVTLLSSDSYLPGALAQAAALRDIHPQPPAFPEVPFQSLCLVTPETVDVSTIKLLRQSFDSVVGVELIEAQDLANLHLLGRPDLTTVFTKLHVFRLTQYSKIIFLDADVLPIRPLSHLFNISHDFAAAPDVGWPDIFNSGVLVLSPGQDKFHDLTSLLKSKGSWDGGDQGILNEWRGGNWHRLSFTYNTTPTAAYTYAPAYERYGSQINVLHFIGPNKPWHSIPFRSPFLAEKRAASFPPTTQQAYHYESLVDRWFAVYDKHYRSQPILPPSFQVKHYPSVWHSSPSVTRPAEEKHFDLEDLRKLAIEGINATGFFTRKDGEGEYRTLPLEGRFDLMRPKKPPAENQKDESLTSGTSFPTEPSFLEADFMDTEQDLSMTPMAQYSDLYDGPRYSHVLPPPGLKVPPDFGLVSKSLLEASKPMSDYYASSAGPTSESEGGSIANNLGSMSIKASHLFTQASRATRHSSHSDSDIDAPVTHIPHHRHHHEHAIKSSHLHHIQHHEGPSKPQDMKDSTFRPPSPPLVSWNPAVEPPPNKPPPPSAFPINPYFSNVWDSARSSEFGHSQLSPGHRSDFFEAPPPPSIPETLRAEGHYRNVTGDTVTDPNSVPDLKKVKPVFPWEDKPRQRPERVFPDSDAPSPERFVSPKVVKSSPSPGRSLKQLPLPRLPATLSYSNAWDVDPSIQSYAKRLVQPSPAALVPGGNTWQDWNEKLEASSRDGDDEDNADEDADVDEFDSDDDGKFRQRSRSSPSVAEDTRQVQKSAQKRYRSRGIQTASVQTRSQGVQVSVLVEDRSRRVSRPDRYPTPIPAKQAPRTSDSHTRSGALPDPVLPRTRSVSSSGSLGVTQSGVATPRTRRDFITPSASISPQLSSKMTSQSSVPTKTSVISTAKALPRVSSRSVSTSPDRPFIETTQQALQPAVSIKRRQISNDSSLGSPVSSVGPVSPPDDQPFAPPVRKGTRVWDPARGVESFKRGSEDVLARFLKMGSWEANNR